MYKEKDTNLQEELDKLEGIVAFVNGPEIACSCAGGDDNPW